MCCMYVCNDVLLDVDKSAGLKQKFNSCQMVHVLRMRYFLSHIIHSSGRARQTSTHDMEGEECWNICQYSDGHVVVDR